MADILKQTARGIIRRQSSILLMERWRNDLHYFSIPGGHMEPGETPEQTVTREVLEETTITVLVERQVFEMQDVSSRHLIYLCNYKSGEPALPPESEEAHSADQGNYFKPQWVAIATLPELPFGYWDPLRALLITGLQQGFNSSVKVVLAAKSR